MIWFIYIHFIFTGAIYNLKKIQICFHHRALSSQDLSKVHSQSPPYDQTETHQSCTIFPSFSLFRNIISEKHTFSHKQYYRRVVEYY